MKKTLLMLMALMFAVSAQAQRYPRPRPFPNPDFNTCTFELQKEEWGRFGSWRFEEAFTRSGHYACEDAEYACERERDSRFFSNDYRCVEADRGPQRNERCEYQIRTRFGFEPEIFAATGFGTCGIAEQRCEDALKIKRARGEVGRDAECVRTSGSTPRPPRYVTASCTAAQFAGRARRRTGIEFTESESARSYQEARDRACDEAMRQCRANLRGTMSCDIVD